MSSWTGVSPDQRLNLRAQLEALPDQAVRRPTPLGWLLIGMIRFYQKHISEGRHRCPLGPERNCSRMGLRAVRHWGALQGAFAIHTLLLRKRNAEEGGLLDCDCDL